MKNMVKLFGVTALVAVIGLSFAGCDTGGGDSPAPAEPAAVYTWDAEDDSYRLEITEASKGRAVYTPKSGDTYVLIITFKDGGTKKSSGTVTVSTESTFTLKPSNSSTTFTVTVTTTATNVIVTGMTGTITLESGETKAAPSKVIPVKVYETFTLKANRWDSGEEWTGGILLSDFTAKIPNKGDKFTFKLSGTPDTEMKWINLQITCHAPYQFLGKGYRVNTDGSQNWDLVNLPKDKPFEETFTVDIGPDLRPDFTEIYVRMINALWNKNENNGEIITNDNGGKLPEGTKQDDVMATIRNFKISLVP